MTLALPVPKMGVGGTTLGTAWTVCVTSLPAVPVVTGPRSYCLLSLASSPRLAGLE